MSKYCMDCGAVVTLSAERCRGCAQRYRWSDGDLGSEEVRNRRREGHRRAWERGCYDDMYSREAVHLAHSKATTRLWAEGRYDTAEYKQSHKEGLERRSLNPEYIAELSERMKRRWQNGEFEGVFGGPSSLERGVAEALEELGIAYTPQFSPVTEQFRYDFLLPDRNLLIEVDGDYWHHSKTAEGRGQREKDAAKDAWATKSGYGLMRLRERHLKGCGARNCLVLALSEQGHIRTKFLGEGK